MHQSICASGVAHIGKVLAVDEAAPGKPADFCVGIGPHFTGMIAVRVGEDRPANVVVGNCPPAATA